VVDRGVSDIGKELMKLNISVIFTDGFQDDFIMQSILPWRILITTRPRIFVEDACNYEYGIIAFPVRDLWDPEIKTAKRISKEIVRHKLWRKKHGFVVKLKSGGRPASYKELIG
jgi:hypothetical protein